jgi:hypothetical protein
MADGELILLSFTPLSRVTRPSHRTVLWMASCRRATKQRRAADGLLRPPERDLRGGAPQGTSVAHRRVACAPSRASPLYCIIVLHRVARCDACVGRGGRWAAAVRER